MFYDIREDLTYNALVNLINGGRGIGKTYSTQDFVLGRYFKKGEQFIHLRRTDAELQVAAPTYLNKIAADKYPGYEIEYSRGVYTIDGKPAGYGIPLSCSNKYKSVPFHEVSTIVFEEFLSDGEYLSREPFKLLELLHTVIRLRDDVRLIMLSNAMSRTNPYYLTWDLPTPKVGQRIRVGEFLLHRVEATDAYKEAMCGTRLGKLSKDVGYLDYSLGNEYALDDDIKIERPEKSTNYFCTIFTDLRTFGVIINLSNGHTVITARGDETYPAKIKIKESFTRMIVPRGTCDVFTRRIKGALLADELYYDSEKTQASFKPFIKYLF